MPQPTLQDVHVDAILSEFAMRYQNNAYIGDRVFNSVPVKKQSNKYFTFPKGPMFRDEADIRAPGTRGKGSGYVVSTDNYHCEEYSMFTIVPDEDVINADDPLDPEEDGVAFCLNSVMLRKERIIAGKVMVTGTWGTDDDVEGNWAAGESNTFFTDIGKGIDTILGNTGISPNTLIIDHKTFTELKEESTVIDRTKYTSPDSITTDILAALLELDEVVVGKAIYSSAAEKADGSDFTAVKIWEVNAGKGSGFLYYKDKGQRQTRKTPDAGKIFGWTRDGRGVREARKVRLEPEEALFIRAYEWLDAKITGTDLGYLFYDTIAT